MVDDPTQEVENTPREEEIAAPAEEEIALPRATPAASQYHAVGRRKTAVARVYLRPGKGAWKVNGRALEEYFPRALLQQAAQRPLVATEMHGQFDVMVNVVGGGLRGQAEAVRLGVARALVKMDEEFRSRLRAEELLTRDPREVERKKPGRPKARKRFQFSKR